MLGSRKTLDDGLRKIRHKRVPISVPMDSKRQETWTRYLDHDLTEMVFRNNIDFYDDVRDRKFDVRLFRSSFERRRWCPMQVVGFIALGNILDEKMIFDLLVVRFLKRYSLRFLKEYFFSF